MLCMRNCDLRNCNLRNCDLRNCVCVALSWRCLKLADYA
ncbi:MAG: hypothetical protein D6742_11275 [Cyanobacteria bacterium J069]|nr:MAG: hypothetical protein D6742_11275 [Cyanobacteria bacterium J069]